MGQQDFLNGRYGGAASDTPDYHFGRSMRHVQEMAEIMKPATQPFCPVPQPAPVIHGPVGNEHAASPARDAKQAPDKPRKFDGWAEEPWVAGLAMFLLLAAGGMTIGAILDAPASASEVAVRIILLLVLVYAAFKLAAWRAVLPVTMNIAIAVIAVHHILAHL